MGPAESSKRKMLRVAGYKKVGFGFFRALEKPIVFRIGLDYVQSCFRADPKSLLFELAENSFHVRPIKAAKPIPGKGPLCIQ